jgi:hypothetical protein
MKRDMERRLERLEDGIRMPWSQAERWIVDRGVATNRDTGEVITTEELEGRDTDGRLRIVRTIVSARDGRPVDD